MPVELEQVERAEAADCFVFWQADAGFDLRSFDQAKLEGVLSDFMQRGFINQAFPVARIVKGETYNRTGQLFRRWKNTTYLCHLVIY